MVMEKHMLMPLVAAWGYKIFTTYVMVKKKPMLKKVFCSPEERKKEVNGANTRKRKEWKLQNRETLTWQVYIPWKEKP